MMLLRPEGLLPERRHSLEFEGGVKGANEEEVNSAAG
jgi:hypothetical protein